MKQIAFLKISDDDFLVEDRVLNSCLTLLRFWCLVIYYFHGCFNIIEGAEERLGASQPLLQEPSFNVHLLDCNPLRHAVVFRCHDVGIFAIGREFLHSGFVPVFISFWQSSYLPQLTVFNFCTIKPICLCIAPSVFLNTDHKTAGHLQRIYQMIRPLRKFPVWRKHYMTWAIMNASVLLLRQGYQSAAAILCLLDAFLF